MPDDRLRRISRPSLFSRKISVAIVLIVQTVLLLAVEKLLEPAAVAGLIGGVAAGTIGLSSREEK